MLSPVIEQLIVALKKLPSVGPKSAQRMALHLLERDPQGALRLASALQEAVSKIKQCSQCRNLCETDICSVCQNPKRQNGLLCVLESPADVMAIEQSAIFSGQYFVLHGKLSPIDGIGPEDLGLDHLRRRVMDGNVTEVIIATNPTVEGEATAHFIAEMMRELNVPVSRIAHGVPLGGELEYIDGGTLSHAISSRRVI